MPTAVDQTAISSPNLKVLDIHHPPLKQIPVLDFPKMLYLHPKDKTKEHRHCIVEDKAEMDEKLAHGWRKEPHIPVPPPEDLSGFEVEYDGKPTKGKAA